jgi:hypothetical protein
MSRWDPGDGRPDEVAFGPATTSKRSGHSKFLMLAVGLASGLLLGWLLAAPGRPEAAPEPERDAAETLIAGSINMTGLADANGPVFALELRNAGDEAIEVTDLRFDDLAGHLEGVVPTRLVPGAWSYVSFGAPAGCVSVIPSGLGPARLTFGARGGEREKAISIAGAGRDLLDYYAARCEEHGELRPADLAGTWVLVDAFGEQEFVGSMVWRFDRDGTFVADPDGLALLDVEHAVDGRYSLENGELVVDVEGGHGCRSWDGSVWRASLAESWTPPEPQPLMKIVWVRGTCPAGMPEQIWVLRRVLDGAP